MALLSAFISVAGMAEVISECWFVGGKGGATPPPSLSDLPLTSAVKATNTKKYDNVTEISQIFPETASSGHVLCKKSQKNDKKGACGA